jgi:hypothetical protein
LTRQQASDLNTRQDQVERERPVVVRILNSAADSEHDPMLKNVALWVAAGGDPDYAFRYWLSHEETLSAPNSHPMLELPNQQPALQPKQSEPSPKQAPLTVSEFPQASASAALPQALPSMRPPPTVTPAR